jgi:hypothetical protein
MQATVTAESAKEARAAIYDRHPQTYRYPVSHSAHIMAPATTKVLSIVKIPDEPDDTDAVPAPVPEQPKPKPAKRRTVSKKTNPQPTPDPEAA